MMKSTILNDLVCRYPTLSGVQNDILAAYERIAAAFRAGGKLLTAGNGGSAADAAHIAGELMKAFMKKRPLTGEEIATLEAVDTARGARLGAILQGALPVISLTDTAPVLTAIANDGAPDALFAQQVWGHGRAGDVLLCISTSGNAENLALAAVAAKARGMQVILLTGATGGRLASLADVAIKVPETVTHRIQEYHTPIYHALCMMLEAAFFPL